MANKIAVFIISILLFLARQASAADGEVFIGKYFGSSLRSSPNGDTHPATYTIGIEVGQRVGIARGYVSNERLIDQYVDGSKGGFHPASSKWVVGCEVDISFGISVVAEHMCWHPVDSGGHVEQYNMVKVRYRFGETK